MSRQNRRDGVAAQRTATPLSDTLPEPVTPASEPSADAVRHEEALLDAALTQTFPASDPPPQLPVISLESAELVDDAQEHRLDAAVAMSFPASDPIAIMID
jgi:hypothetical protein